MTRVLETDLYQPVKTYLEARGYQVKSEVAAADVVARRADAPPLIVELKTGFSLALLHQACARLALSDDVYVCVPRQAGRSSYKALLANVKLCRRLGLGVMTVRLLDGLVEVHADPGPYSPRKSASRQRALLREFDRRQGDPNKGGTRGKIMTAYRQDALACAIYLAEAGAARGADVAKATAVPRATRLMADNHYGWFARVTKGVYQLTDEGRNALPKAAVPVAKIL